MQILYSTKDNSLNYRLEYITSRPMRKYKGFGKSWPTTTQCIIYENGCLISIGTVVKHDSDEENSILASKLATKKAIRKIKIKFIRKDIWEIFFKKNRRYI